MEYTPHKKEELSIANNVLKLASKLLRVCKCIICLYALPPFYTSFLAFSNLY